MKKSYIDVSLDEQGMESLLLHFQNDRYKVAYLALRWAKEIKQKESLPDSIPTLVPRALREILTKKISLDEIEALPILARPVSTPVAQAPVPHPTITLNIEPEKKGKDKDKDDEEEEDEDDAKE